jgi:hypothetical protein
MTTAADPVRFIMLFLPPEAAVAVEEDVDGNELPAALRGAARLLHQLTAREGELAAR